MAKPYFSSIRLATLIVTYGEKHTGWRATDRGSSWGVDCTVIGELTLCMLRFRDDPDHHFQILRSPWELSLISEGVVCVSPEWAVRELGTGCPESVCPILWRSGHLHRRSRPLGTQAIKLCVFYKVTLHLCSLCWKSSFPPRNLGLCSLQMPCGLRCSTTDSCGLVDYR